MRKKKKVELGIIGAIVLIGLAYGGTYTLDVLNYKDAMSDLTIGEIDLSSIDDGIYVGSYDAKIISATVKVTVKDGKITDIELTDHKYDRGEPAVAVVDKILKEQSLNVDVVSGATNSSKTILKAVENALNQSDTLEHF